MSSDFKSMGVQHNVKFNIHLLTNQQLTTRHYQITLAARQLHPMNPGWSLSSMPSHEVKCLIGLLIEACYTQLNSNTTLLNQHKKMKFSNWCNCMLSQAPFQTHNNNVCSQYKLRFLQIFHNPLGTAISKFWSSC